MSLHLVDGLPGLKKQLAGIARCPPGTLKTVGVAGAIEAFNAAHGTA